MRLVVVVVVVVGGGGGGGDPCLWMPLLGDWQSGGLQPECSTKGENCGTLCWNLNV